MCFKEKKLEMDEDVPESTKESRFNVIWKGMSQEEKDVYFDKADKNAEELNFLKPEPKPKPE